MNKPSEEQEKAIKSLESSNVIVSAVPGSGKTTTIGNISLYYPNQKILALTYSAKLKVETRNLAKQNNLFNLEVHSYHSFCVRYLKSNCFTDFGIRKSIGSGFRRDFNYDMIIVDEAQDMTLLYYDVVCKIIHEHVNRPKICILGDEHQSIFQFNGADNRFLKMGDKLFNFNDYPWIKCNFSLTFRLTDGIADFINNCVINEKRIRAVKKGPKVRYVICDTFPTKYGGISKTYYPYEETKEYLKDYPYEKIFILAPSVKSDGSPVRLLANKLTDMGVPVYVPNNDDEKVDEHILNGKLAILTFHQAKGLERDVVLVFNFSDSYFQYYVKDPDANHFKCPNPIYVAISRAKERLTIFHHHRNSFFKFVDINKLSDNTELVIRNKLSKSVGSSKGKTKVMAVTDLTKHLPSEVISEATKLLEKTLIQPKGETINIETKTKQRDLYENVGEITGTAIPSYYEYLNKRSMNIHTVLCENGFIGLDEKKEEEKDPSPNLPRYGFIDPTNDLESFQSEESDGVEDNEDDDDDLYNIDNMSISKLLKISNQFCAYMSGYNYKLNQIRDYNWLSIDNLERCIDRIKERVGSNANHEIIVKYCDNDHLIKNNKYLAGSIDCIDGNNIWEFKCVNELKDDHFLQLATYAFIIEYNIKLKERLLVKRLNKIKEFSKQLDEGPVEADNIFIETDDQDFEILERYKDSMAKCRWNGIICTINLEKFSLSKKYRNYKLDSILDYEETCSDLDNIRSKNYRYFLFNILTDEIYQITADYEVLEEMVNYLLENKFNNDITISESEFLSKANEIKEKYLYENELLKDLRELED